MYSRTKLPESLPVETVRGFTPDLAGLVAWLETQNPETTYNFRSGADCVLCRFVAVLDGHPPKDWIVVMDRLPEMDTREAAYPDDLYAVIQTYSAALSRGRAELSRARSALREGEMK